MPIVIQEIHIKAVVEETSKQTGSTQNTGGNDAQGNSKNEIIKECVEEIMRIIKEKTER